jgi:ribosome maturation factor RimP
MENNINELIEKYFEDSIDYRMIDLIIRGDRSNKIVEVYIDNETGVEVDNLSKINRDLNEVIEKKYEGKDISKLVVSSPGVERVFKYIWQLKKHIGRVIDVILSSDEKLAGKLLEVQDNSENYIIIDTNDISKQKKKNAEPELHKISFTDIKESKIKLNF